MMTRPTDPLDRIAELTFDELSAEASELRAKINRFREALGRYFVDKQGLIDLMTISAVAQ